MAALQVSNAVSSWFIAIESIGWRPFIHGEYLFELTCCCFDDSYHTQPWTVLTIDHDYIVHICLILAHLGCIYLTCLFYSILSRTAHSVMYLNRLLLRSTFSFHCRWFDTLLIWGRIKGEWHHTRHHLWYHNLFERAIDKDSMFSIGFLLFSTRIHRNRGIFNVRGIRIIGMYLKNSYVSRVLLSCW